MPFFAAFAFLLAAAFAPLTAQLRMDNWQTYTSMYNARCADIDSKGIVWVGTTGGMYSLDPATGEAEIFRNIDALLNLNVSVVRIEPGTDAVYAGCSDGSINVYRNGKWEYITAIRAKGDEFASVQINDMLFDGDRVFIAGDFGVTIYYPASRTFGATITNFNGVRNIPVAKLLTWRDRLWVATGNGIFSAPLATTQFNLPSIWQPYTFKDFDGVVLTRDIAVYSDTLFAGLGKHVWKLEDNNFVQSMSLDTTVVSILSSPEGLFAADMFSVVRYPNQVLYNKRRPNNLVNSLTRLPASLGTPGILYSKYGLSTAPTTDSLVFHTPNSPQSNLFMDMSVSPDGGLWAATMKDDAASGFFRLKDGVWKNFTVDNYPKLLNDAFVQINASPNGDIWASSWGFGLAHLVPENGDFNVTMYDSSNSPVRGIFSRSGSFEVMGETATDANGVTWIINHTERLLPGALLAYKPDGTFLQFMKPGGTGSNWYFNSLVVDQSGTKWLAAPNSESGDILYFNDRGTLDNTADDVWGTVDAASTSLPGIVIFGMAVDKNGVLWLAGEKGLYVIDNPFAVISKSRLFTRSIPALAGQFVNCVIVDALNQKWAGTNSGVWVLNEDGTEVRAHFTKDNTPMLEDIVASLATDEKTGTIYIGTRSGLTVANSLSIRPNVDFNSLRCFPQPFVLMQDDELRVEGLAQSSVVKVATIDGILVRTIDSRGSRAAVWDGRDENGEFVQSGVYLISGFSETSGERSVVKAMVIRRD